MARRTRYTALSSLQCTRPDFTEATQNSSPISFAQLALIAPLLVRQERVDSMTALE